MDPLFLPKNTEECYLGKSYPVSALVPFGMPPFFSHFHVPTISRLLSQMVGAQQAYARLQDELEAAPGQLSDSPSTATKPTAPSKTSPTVTKKTCSCLWFDTRTRKKTFAKHERRVSNRERLFPRFWKLETYVGKSKQYQKLFFKKCINYKTKVGNRKKAFVYSLLLHLLLIKGSSINSEKTDSLKVWQSSFRLPKQFDPLICTEMPLSNWNTPFRQPWERDSAAMGAAHPRWDDGFNISHNPPFKFHLLSSASLAHLL